MGNGEEVASTSRLIYARAPAVRSVGHYGVADTLGGVGWIWSPAIEKSPWRTVIGSSWPFGIGPESTHFPGIGGA
jgi:hypothetical protein